MGQLLIQCVTAGGPDVQKGGLGTALWVAAHGQRSGKSLLNGLQL